MTACEPRRQGDALHRKNGSGFSEIPIMIPTGRRMENMRKQPFYAGGIIRFQSVPFAKTIGAETNHPFKAATRYGSTKEASFAFQQKTEQE